MKRLMVFLIMVCFVGVLSAQTSNTFKYVLKSQGGIINTKKGLAADKIDSMKVSSDKIWFFQGADTLIVGITSDGSLNLFDYAARKYLTDTLHITAAADTMEASWAGKMINCTHATFQNITILPNTMPVGSIVTFTKYGAGPVKITPAAGVTRFSVLDSTTMNTVNQTYQIEFSRGANKPKFIGDWRD